MSSKYDKDKQKWVQDKCQNLLSQLLKEDDNKYCADCDAKGPRWASWNIGVFLCIRCAGIHRNLGVHISKVKSVNLDSWLPAQVVSIQRMGNSKARAVYEAKMPDNFRRPQIDSGLETFIRAKYEHKKYIAKDWVAPPVPEINWDKEWEEESDKARKKKKDTVTKITTPPARPASVNVPAPLPKPTGSSPKPSRTNRNVASTVTNRQSSHLSQDLLGLDAPADFTTFRTSDPEFNAFISALPTGVQLSTSNLPCDNRTAEENSFFNQPYSNMNIHQQQQQLTTDSILALYDNSQPVAASHSMFPFSSQGITPQVPLQQARVPYQQQPVVYQQQQQVTYQSQQPSVVYQQQAVGYQQQPVGYQQPVGFLQQQPVGYLQPVASQQQQQPVAFQQHTQTQDRISSPYYQIAPQTGAFPSDLCVYPVSPPYIANPFYDMGTVQQLSGGRPMTTELDDINLRLTNLRVGQQNLSTTPQNVTTAATSVQQQLQNNYTPPTTTQSLASSQPNAYGYPSLSNNWWQN